MLLLSLLTMAKGSQFVSYLPSKQDTGYKNISYEKSSTSLPPHPSDKSLPSKKDQDNEEKNTVDDTRLPPVDDRLMDDVYGGGDEELMPIIKK